MEESLVKTLHFQVILEAFYSSNQVSSFFVKAVSSALDISGQKQLTVTKASIWVALTTLLQAHVNGRKHKMAIQKLEFNGKIQN